MKRKNLPLNALRSFEASARLGRQTSAADELGVTHGAINRQIQQLESYLGLPLFEGARKSPVLTAVGRQLLPVLSKSFDEITHALSAIQSESSGTLDIGCLSTFAMRWLMPRLHRFHQAFPEIDIRLDTNEHRHQPTQGRFDVLITVLDAQSHPIASDTVLFAERLGVVMTPAFQAVHCVSGIEHLAEVVHLSTASRSNAWATWYTAMSQTIPDISLKSMVVYDHYYFAIEAANSGLGACAAPEHLVASDIAAGRLIAPFDFFETGYRYVARKKQAGNSKASRFCQWLKHEVSLS